MEALRVSSIDVAAPLQRGRYRLMEIMGHGGMADVYRGFDERLSTPLAIKVLKPTLANSGTLRERFEQEARTMARLRANPHVVIVHDFGQDDTDQRMFIAMELMEGGSLQGRLDRMGPLPARIAVEAMIAVLVALEAAHSIRVVHRDVKPSNILVNEAGVPKVADFGIARIIDSDKHRTRSGAGVGTWAFMAPEQKRSAATVDFRADLYATGATLFALLTNQEPYDLDRPNAHDGTMALIPEELRVIVARATQYRPEDRYPSAAAMREALMGVLEELPPNPPGIASLADALGLRARTPPAPAGAITLVPMPLPEPHQARPDSVQGNYGDGPAIWPPPEDKARPWFWMLALPLALGVVAFAVWTGRQVPHSSARGPGLLQEGLSEIAAAIAVVNAPLPHAAAEGMGHIAAALSQIEEGGRILIHRPVPRPPDKGPTTTGPLPPPPVATGRATLTAIVPKGSGANCKILLDGKPLFDVGEVRHGLKNNIAAGTHTVTCQRDSGTSRTLAKTDFAPGETYDWEIR